MTGGWDLPKQVPPLRLAIDKANRNAPAGITDWNFKGETSHEAKHRLRNSSILVIGSFIGRLDFGQWSCIGSSAAAGSVYTQPWLPAA